MNALLIAVTTTGNPVLVRVDVNDDVTPQAYVRSVNESLGRRFSNEVGRCHPSGQVSFGVRERSHPEEIRPEPEYDISVQLDSNSPSFAGYFEYAENLWNAGEAETFAMNYIAAVEQLAETATDIAGYILADVRCLSAKAHQILESINDTGRAFPRSSVDELFRVAAHRWPAAPAVRDATSELTYAELCNAAVEQARLLRAVGVREGDRVLIGLPRSVAEAVAVLGTLWVGATYVGVDLTQPQSHTSRIIAKSSPAAAIVADDETSHLALRDIPLVGSWRRGWEKAAGSVAPARPDPDRLAYIAFTSGSTGEPKGVAVPHRAVIRLVYEARYLGLDPGERLLRISPLAFDASTLELWGGLLSGAALEVCPPEFLSPNEIGAFLAERGVTVAWLTAGLFRLVQEFAGESLGGLRHLLTGGDVVSHEHIKRALLENPDLLVTNGYGPTENTTFTTAYTIRDPASVDGPIPIGSPIPGTRVYVLDKNARLLMPGAVGELFVAGEGLALGYFADKTETDRAFGFFSPDVNERLYRTGDLVRIDEAGQLRFLGRADDQVKIRGFRIELHAISESLSTQEGVEESVVTVTEGDSSEKRLIAAVRLTPGTAVTPADLRDRLRDHLPSYMVPPLWAVVDRLPVTANGKIDRRRLAAIAVPANGFAKQGKS
ncbi:amino acid adenylation domain-containing protein [Streptomyces sp. 1222.5]|uniref:amino acid adenylation domain-containing protein n=1 Tax=Streptomyces sp. 1222.5 TaxID=1881026 RepID=UPI003EBF2E95